MDSDSIWRQENDCTGFVSDAVFDSALSHQTYEITIRSSEKNPMEQKRPHAHSTSIRMAVRRDEGGVVTFDDDARIIQKVYPYTDEAIDAFRELVDSSIEDYRNKSLELEFDIDMGKIPIEFDNLNTESPSN